MSLEAAIAARAPFIDDAHQGAFRLFNGFTEGMPSLVLDVYATALLVQDNGGAPTDDAIALVREKLPWITSVVLKSKGDKHVVFGELPNKVKENDLWFAIDLLMGQDSSFYLDTRNLRTWAKALGAKKVLNTFAYTGSLSVAARAGGAHVITTDANKHVLNVARRSFQLNGFEPKDFRTADFFDAVARLKREDALFDCVFLDPPIFSKGARGKVDTQADMAGLINKVRPLVAHEGYLVAVNNAVFTSGAEYKAQLDALCEGGYLSIDRLIDVPADCAGHTHKVDPAPFNHSTKIAVLRAVRKDGRK